MATVESRTQNGEATGACREEVDGEVMLANALKRMVDEVVGESSPIHSTNQHLQDPLAVSVVAQCDALKTLVRGWEEKIKTTEGRGGGKVKDVRFLIPQETRQFLVLWLSGDQAGSFTNLGQLERDKEQLLWKVVDIEMQHKQAALQVEVMNRRLSELQSLLREREAHSHGQLSELQSLLREKEALNQYLGEQLRDTRHILEAREGEIALLNKEKGVWPSGYHDDWSPSSPTSVEIQLPDAGKMPPSDVEHGLHGSHGNQGMSRKRSIRRSLVSAFSRKKSPSNQNAGKEGEGEGETQRTNVRASAFHAQDRYQLGQWMEGVGLEMYKKLIEQHVPSGDSMVAIARKQDSSDLMHIGLVNVLHCKKLRLAVDDALQPRPSALGTLGHSWVAEWLQLIGLPQLVTTFSEARIDGNMLNVISMGDLQLLGVTEHFHLLSLFRAIQAFRLCGYSPNYLKNPSAASKGSQKLLHWSARDVGQWLCSIDLDEYARSLHGRGLHGAIMLLEVRFTNETLARLLGIHESKALIRKHLMRKFLELLGPVAAQRKLDAMQSKSFQPIDPTEKGKGKLRRGRHHPSPEELLCPLDEFPPVEAAHLPRPKPVFSAPQALSSTTTTTSTPSPPPPPPPPHLPTSSSSTSSPPPPPPPPPRPPLSH